MISPCPTSPTPIFTLWKLPLATVLAAYVITAFIFAFTVIP